MEILSSSFLHPPSTILVFGEVLYDCIRPADALNSRSVSEVLGGAPANFAYRLHTRRDLKDNLDVKLVSAIGWDTRGKNTLKILKNDGLDTSYLQRNNSKPTGTVDVSRHSDGNVSYIINTGVAYENIDFNSPLAVLATKTQFIYFGSLIQRNATGSAATLHRLLDFVPSSTQKFVDINLRKDCYTPESLRWSCDKATILKLNHEEVPQISDVLGIQCASPKEFAVTYATKSQKKVIVTFAENGALVAYPTEHGRTECDYEPGYKLSKEQIVDTVGCGDSFSAEFVRLYLQGATIRKCLEKANEIGAAVALTKGGMSPVEERHLEQIRGMPRNRSITLELALKA